MRIALFTLAFFSIISASSALAQQEIRNGSEVTVLNWKWVEVKNTQPIKNGNNTFIPGAQCGVEVGGVVTVVKIDGNDLVVRYSIGGPRQNTTYGTLCPTGVFFSTTRESFSRMLTEYGLARRAYSIKSP